MDDIGNLKVDVGVLKNQVNTITTLCGKMDQVIDKLVDQHDRHITKVYVDMEARRLEKDSEIKELHDRIDTVLEKMETTERRIMDKMDELGNSLVEHRSEEKKQLESLLQWKWMIAGGILVMSYLISHVTPDIILKSFK